VFEHIGCACNEASATTTGNSVKEFGELRGMCPALKEVLVPDRIWADFEAAARGAREDSPFESMLLLAFERSFLSKLTFPIHRYLLDDDELRSGIRPGYMTDLGETWHLRASPYKQNEKGRGYLGKVTELQVAESLERMGSTVVSLEAWTPDGQRTPDIVAASPYGVDYSVEVKYLGRSDKDFEAQYDAFLGFCGAQWLSPKGLANYLLSRVYEAADQLRKADSRGRRVACLVLSNETWTRLGRMVLEDKWIDWSSPQFLSCPEDADWAEHLKTKLLPDYPEIENDLGVLISSLQHVWFVSSDNRFRFAMQRVVNAPGT